MKKFLIILSILCLSLPCFAGNLLQQEYEASRMQEIAQESVFRNMSKRGVIEDDYNGYLGGKDSLYGVILYKKEELENFTSPAKYVNLRYLNLVLKGYNLVIKNQSPQMFAPDKIIVDDKDYKQLDEDIKSIIAGFNIFMAK